MREDPHEGELTKMMIWYNLIQLIFHIQISFPQGLVLSESWLSSQPIKNPENMLETSYSFFRNWNQNSKILFFNIFTRGTQFQTQHAFFKTIFVEINPDVNNTLACWD